MRGANGSRGAAAVPRAEKQEVRWPRGGYGFVVVRRAWTQLQRSGSWSAGAGSSPDRVDTAS